MKFSIFLFTAFLIFAAASFAAAQQKVIVIPLMDDAKNLKNVVTVSPANGDYTNPASAVASITNASESNPYLVVIGPGVYTLSGALEMKPYVYLQGSGKGATVITGIGQATDISIVATLVMASNTCLGDLTVENTGTTGNCSALLVPKGTTKALIKDVAVNAEGACTNNYAIYVTGIPGDETEEVLENVNALAQNAASANRSVYNEGNSYTLIQGGTYAGKGGTSTAGIYNSGAGAKLVAYDFDALGEEGSISNYGFYNEESADAMLYSGSCIAHDGGIGISNYKATLYAENINAFGDGSSSSYNQGLASVGDNAKAVLLGGSYIARQANFEARGIFAWGVGSTLEATGCLIMAEDGDENYGVSTQTEVEADLVRCTIEGSDNAIRRNHTSGSVTVSHSRLKGGSVTSTVTCVCNTMAGVFYENTCP